MKYAVVCERQIDEFAQETEDAFAANLPQEEMRPSS
jgi:hypothetical protein